MERQAATIQAYRQDLTACGVAEEQSDAVGKDEFLTEITVYAPAADGAANDSAANREAPFTFEVESLEVELGQQVAAGDVLFKLADHRQLLIEGRGLKTTCH